MEFAVEYGVYENGKKAPQYDLVGDLHGELTLQELLALTKQTLILVADEVLKEEQTLGFDKQPVVIVDGSTSKKVFDVKPLGSIEFVSRANMSDILQLTYENILEKSPVLTGKYKRSNFVFFNGTQVAAEMSELQAWLNTNPDFHDGDKIRFVNIEPYARKLERHGVTSDSARATRVRNAQQNRKLAGKPVNVLAPNGTYYLTYRAIKSKYKRNSNIRFEFISGASLGLAGTGGNFVAKRGKPGRPYLYPSILITVAEDGILDVE